MRHATRAYLRHAALLAASLLVFPAGALPPAERVRFQSLDRNGSTAVTIEGLLYRPDGAGTRERPAIVALHGCGGLYSNVPGRDPQWKPLVPTRILIGAADDWTRGKVVHRKDVPNGVHPGQGVHVGPDPEARADANQRVAAFLREILAR